MGDISYPDVSKLSIGILIMFATVICIQKKSDLNHTDKNEIMKILCCPGIKFKINK